MPKVPRIRARKGRGMRPTLRVVLNFLKSKGAATARGCWWRQKKMAAELGIPLRSLQRYLSQLEDLGEIRIHHRCSTTNLYFVCGNVVENKTVLAGGAAKMADLNYKTEASTPKEKQACSLFPKRKPTTFPTLDELVPYEIPNGVGRIEPNPEYQRIARLLYRAERRIAAAENPAAYRAAIIDRESAAFREWLKLPEVQGHMDKFGKPMGTLNT